MAQAQLLVGPTPASGSWVPKQSSRTPNHRRRWRPMASSSSSWPSSRTAFGGEQNHYDVLGLNQSATTADVKRAYRLLARKYHPDVSKESQSGEAFKSIRHAYEVLSNDATRTQYDTELQFQEDRGTQHRVRWSDCCEYHDGIRTYRWAEFRQRMQREKYWEKYDTDDEESPFYSEEDEEVEGKKTDDQERGAFTEVLRSALVSIFLMQTFGCLFSLTYSSFMALLDRKLDAGYKIGYLIAWILGGRGGILLTMCLSFASWVCGKTSSSVVVLVVVAMWVGSNLARYAPLPQGALLTLLYMSIKLQVDLN
ncbi:hypothetical protein CRG98_045529 [Punica granatum]|nr:hypothetical protein CRG98_045529 [Punica granatum]